MIGFLDLPSGLSGDMFLGCLVDAGWSLQRLRATISHLLLPSSEWEVAARDVKRGALRATLVEVRVAEGLSHRGLSDVMRIIEAADLPEEVRRRSAGVFRRLAEAEAKVHGTAPEKIHFHEVGAVDAIVDVVGAVAGLHELGVEQLFAGPLPLGEGWVSTAHGLLPLPGPATLELLAAAKAPTRPAPGPGEWVTPTGAALLTELAAFGQPPLTLERIGTGAGTRDAEWPNVARLWLGHPEAAGSLVQLETNLDDMNPQLFPDASERLLGAGALDVWLTPVQMKKGRPGVVLSLLAPASREAALADLLLRHTTTLGVRVHRVDHRHEARRELRPVETPFGEVRVKVRWVGGMPVGASPEYEDCADRAAERGASVREVWEAALSAARALLSELTSAR